MVNIDIERLALETRKMDFTYKCYRKLLKKIADLGYVFSDYENWMLQKKCVIMRHDVDESLKSALRIANIENEEGIQSTFFLLLKTDMYNVASYKSLKYIREIIALGHNIGLHFDECAYDNKDDLEKKILDEAKILSEICEERVRFVSMHRPSKEILESDLDIPEMQNSYSKIFFKEFKYLSDSRRNWREPVEQILESEVYPRLHILTHPFHYHESDMSLKDNVCIFLSSALVERYQSISENITGIDQLFKEGDVGEDCNSSTALFSMDRIL